MIRDGSYRTNDEGDDEIELNLNWFMNNVARPALKIPDSVVWGSQSGPVFDTLNVDFMKPVTEGS